MHRHLVPPVSPRLAPLVWLLALGLLAPAGLDAQTHPVEDMRQAAAERVWVRQYLRLYDQVLSMQAALGMMTGQEADARLAAAGRELHQQGFHDADMNAVRDALRATAGPFLDSVEGEIARSTAWPTDMPAEAYRSLTGRLLRYARSELDRSLARGADPIDALRAATFVLALTRGHESIPAEIDYFAGSAARAAGSVPAIDLMPMDAAAPTVPAAGVRPPAPAAGGAGGWRVPTRVNLTQGPVEADARLLGPSASADFVARGARLSADGRRDTEIELWIRAPGFVVETIEIRNELVSDRNLVGRAVNRVLGRWSTRPGQNRPLVAVVARGQVLNRANGSVAGLVLEPETVLSLYIQDDGQLGETEVPGTVVVQFRGGERASFPISLPAIRIPSAPAGGGTTPPVILAGLPPRTMPAGPMTGRPAAPGAPGGVTIPRTLPPPQPGGVPPATRPATPPVTRAPGTPTPVGPVGGGGPPMTPPAIRPPMVPPSAAMPPGAGAPVPPVRTPPVTTPPPVVTPPPATGAAPSRLSAFQVTWVGMDADVVTKGGEVRPDGSPDAHFRVETSFSFWQDVTHFALYSSDAGGNPSGGQGWHSQNGGYWLLAVMSGGLNLNARHVPSIGKFNGSVTLDLYAGDSGWFTPGQTFVVEMGMGPAQAVAQVVQAGAAGAPPVTPPVVPPVVPPVTGGGGGAPPGVETATGSTNAAPLRGRNGERFAFWCPPGTSGGSVWGTDVYTDDTSVCTAALHAGVITLASGGTVSIEIRPGQASYAGSARNGVTSASYGSWSGSFVFVGAGGGAPPPTFAGNVQANAAWVGMDADMVSTGTTAAPDGQPDAHFALTLDASAPYEIRSIELQSADPQGNLSGGQVWSTRPGGYWILGAATGGARVNAGQVESLGTWQGRRQFELYAASSGWFNPGQHFLILVDVGLSEPLRRLVSIPDLPGVVPPPVFTGAIQTDQAAYVEGQPITVTFTGFPASYDWIAIAPAGSAVESYGEWKWTDGSSTSGAPSGSPRRDGTLSFTAPAAGSYEVRVFTDWPNGGHTIQAARPFTVSAPAPPPVSVAIDASWIGTEADVVGEYGNGAPDGRPDGHFTLDLSSSAAYELRSIMLFISDAAGNRSGSDTWHSQNSGYWMLRVATGGQFLNSGHVATLGPVQGARRFDLYANSNNSFNESQYFTIEVDVGLAQPLRRTVQVRGGLKPPVTFAGAIQTDRGSYVEGQPITVTFTGFPVTNDWIAIAPAGSGAESYGEWKWTDGSSTSGAPSGSPRREGTLSFTAPAPGNYEARVFIDWPGGGHTIHAARPFTVYARPPDVTVAYDAAWVGMDADVVAPGATASPDGQADAHISLAIDINTTYEVRSIGFYSADAQGNLSGGQAWSTHNGGHWVLGAAAGGSLLNSGHVATLGTWQGLQQFELFAASSGWFNPGQHFLVEVDVGLAEPLRAVVRIPDSFVPPGATPPPVVPPPPAAFAGQIYPDAQAYLEGQTITVTFTGFPGTNDWITIAPAGAAAETYGEWNWTNGAASGTIAFTAPAPGNYEVRAYANWPDAGYTVVASYPITVQAAGGGYPRDLLVAYDAAWVGMDVDLVSPGASAVPDGQADAHFSLVVDINTQYEVRYVTVYSADTEGNPSGGQVWHTQNGGYWALGVATQGAMLNAGHVATLGSYQGRHQFELFAASSGWFNPGQHFVVEVDVGLSEPLRRVVQVAGGAAGGGQGGGVPAGAEGAIQVNANQSTAVTTGVLETGRWYILEASGTISVWDAQTDRIDAVWCYTVDYCGASGQLWEQLRVDGQGLSSYSAAAGGPATLPYDTSHVYRVYVQGQGRPIELVVADAAAGSGGDNAGAFFVTLTPQ